MNMIPVLLRLNLDSFRLFLLIQITCATISGSIGASAHAVELVRNGSFEEGTPPLGGGPLLFDWDDGLGQGNDLGYDVNPYPDYEKGIQVGGVAGFELPPGIHDQSFTGLAAPKHAGGYYGRLWGIANGTAARGSATQVIDVSQHAGKAFSFSAWLASRILDTDYATVTLGFFSGFDGVGDELGSVSFDGSDQMSPLIVGSLNLQGLADPTIPATQDNWSLYRATGIVPSGARSAAVVIEGAVVSTGGGNDGIVDLVSLHVVPEPSTIVLLLVAFSLVTMVVGRASTGDRARRG